MKSISKRSWVLGTVIAVLVALVAFLYFRPAVAPTTAESRELTKQAVADAEKSADSAANTAQSAATASRSARKAADSTRRTAESADSSSKDATDSARDAAKSSFDQNERQDQTKK